MPCLKNNHSKDRTFNDGHEIESYYGQCFDIKTEKNKIDKITWKISYENVNVLLANME